MSINTTHDAHDNRALAHLFIQNLPQETLEHHMHDRGFDLEAVEPIANELQDFIAEVISSLIDAGSERDAVNESEDLHTALTNELKGWADPS